jgi:hypothetical protein
MTEFDKKFTLSKDPRIVLGYFIETKEESTSLKARIEKIITDELAKSQKLP